MENDSKLLLKLPTDLRVEAQALADQLERSLSWVIRDALKAYLKEHGHGA